MQCCQLLLALLCDSRQITGEAVYVKDCASIRLSFFVKASRSESHSGASLTHLDLASPAKGQREHGHATVRADRTSYTFDDTMSHLEGKCTSVPVANVRFLPCCGGEGQTGGVIKIVMPRCLLQRTVLRPRFWTV